MYLSTCGIETSFFHVPTKQHTCQVFSVIEVFYLHIHILFNSASYLHVLNYQGNEAIYLLCRQTFPQLHNIGDDWNLFIQAAYA